MAGSGQSSSSGPEVQADAGSGAVARRPAKRAWRGWAPILPGLVTALAIALPATAAGIATVTATVTATQAAAQDHPAQLDQLANEASAAREQGDLPRAVALYQQAVQLDPGWPDGWWYLGSLQYGANAYGPAVDALSHFIDLTPNAGPAHALRGLCEFELAQYPQSLDDLQKAMALGAANQPRNAEIILYHEALLLTKLGRFEEALGQYAAMVKQGAAGEDVTKGIGLAGLRMPILPADIDPSQAQLVSMTGQAAAIFMSGNQTGAAQAFQELFTQFPTTPNLHYLYAYLLFPTDPDEAIAQFREELAVAPESAIAHAMLAWGLGMQGEYAAALPQAQKAAAEDPSLSMAQLVLGRDMVETGDVGGGLPHLEGVLKKEPQNLEAHIALAKAYSELGRRDDARRERLLCLSLAGRGISADANM